MKNALGRLVRNKSGKARTLPKGFKAASPIKNKVLRDLLMGRDITTSGGTHTVINGRPLLKGKP